MEAVFGFLCRVVTIDTGPQHSLTAQQILQTLYAQTFPATDAGFWLVSHWEGTEAEADRLVEVRLKIDDDAGKAVMSWDPMSFSLGATRLPDRVSIGDIVSEIKDVTFPRPGTYRVKVLIDGETRLSMRLNLVEDKPPV